MSNKENARAAWGEVRKMVGLEKSEESAAPVENKESAPAKPVKTVVEAAEPVKKVEVTVIAEGTTVHGDIKTAGDLTVKGEVHGNIQCAGVLQCSGTIQGNMSAQEVVFVAAKIKGDVKATSMVQIGLNTVMVGNVQAENISLDGKLKGDLVISGTTQINANAVLLGNINTERLAMFEGSHFSGALEMSGCKDLSSSFPKEVTV